jgi:nucleotide-binding universal stress UspA family protein
MFKRLVVPLDGSELAEAALTRAEELATLTRAGIHLVRVIDLISGRPMRAYLAMEAAGFAEAAEAEAEESQEYLEDVRRGLTERGFNVTTEIRRGAARSELIELVQPGDVMVMATHGRGGLTRWLLGSVAEDVARHSPVPVLLVRAGETQPTSTVHPSLVGADVA